MWINCAREDIFLVLLVYCQTILSLSGLCFESNPILRSTLCLLPFVCSVMDHFPVDWLVCLCSVFNWMGRSSVAQSPYSHIGFVALPKLMKETNSVDQKKKRGVQVEMDEKRKRLQRRRASEVERKSKNLNLVALRLLGCFYLKMENIFEKQR